MSFDKIDRRRQTRNDWHTIGKREFNLTASDFRSRKRSDAGGEKTIENFQGGTTQTVENRISSNLHVPSREPRESLSGHIHRGGAGTGVRGGNDHVYRGPGAGLFGRCLYRQRAGAALLKLQDRVVRLLTRLIVLSASDSETR